MSLSYNVFEILSVISQNFKESCTFRYANTCQYQSANQIWSHSFTHASDIIGSQNL